MVFGTDMIYFFMKFYLICSLIYITVSYDDDMRNQRTMMRGRPDKTYLDKNAK